MFQLSTGLHNEKGITSKLFQNIIWLLGAHNLLSTCRSLMTKEYDNLNIQVVSYTLLSLAGRGNMLCSNQYIIMLLGTCILFHNVLDLLCKQQNYHHHVLSVQKHERDISLQGKAPHKERNCFLNEKNEKKMRVNNPSLIFFALGTKFCFVDLFSSLQVLKKQKQKQKTNKQTHILYIIIC